MSTHVVGVDPSLTAAGIAVIAHPSIATTPNVPRVVVVGEHGHDTDSPAETAMRIKRQREAILKSMPRTVALVVIESLGFPHPKAPGKFRERVALLGGIAEFLAWRGIPFVEVPAASLKFWATGDGNADKPIVHAAMLTMWPRSNLHGPNGGINDNASDALALATLGAQHLGWYEPELPHHYAPKVKWPKEIAHV
jgi:crossover junction endodeoxyribonuclease RuvC